MESDTEGKSAEKELILVSRQRCSQTHLVSLVMSVLLPGTHFSPVLGFISHADCSNRADGDDIARHIPSASQRDDSDPSNNAIVFSFESPVSSSFPRVKLNEQKRESICKRFEGGGLFRGNACHSFLSKA